MTCSAQAVSLAESLKAVAMTNPDAYADLEAMDPALMFAVVSDFAAMHMGGDGQPTFKPRPKGQNIACYFIADYNYAQNLQACSLISDPAIRKQCEAKALETYCEAFELCGGVK